VAIFGVERGPLEWRCRQHGVIEPANADEPYVPRLCPVLDANGRPCSLPLYLAQVRPNDD
jgi:hypothetical protein